MNPENRADLLLGQLRRGPDKALHIAGRLRLSETEIAQAVETLEERGYRLATESGGVLRLVGVPDLLIADEIEHSLGGAGFGRPLFTYGSLGSTNTVALQLAESGSPEGTLVTAEEQTEGRGRQGRSWHSPPGLGIWMSLILRPKLDPARAAGLSIVAGVAIAAAMEGPAGARVRIKWPNDVLIDDRKVAGVLCESVLEGMRVRHTVVGIGVNVNHKPDEIPPLLRDRAVSLRVATGRPHDRVELLAAIIGAFEQRYRTYAGDRPGPVLAEFRERSGLIGRGVRITQDGGGFDGTVLDITNEGSLLVSTQAGPRTVAAGEASLRMD
jgi:BirA family biotin operon repressor/biotin-[acetyl-CoA-carboxylase] ligase